MLRFNDDERTLELGVHDLVDAGPATGHLRLQIAWSARTRMRAGQEAHTTWQAQRASEDAGFQREVSVHHRVVVRDWEVTIRGRIDGVSEEGDRLVVEELKSSTLPADRLSRLVVEDVAAWALQVRLYLWFLEAQGQDAIGRLVVVSLHDGARRLIHVPVDPDLEGWVRAQLDYLLLHREERIAWRARRQSAPVPFPHDAWRPGQQDMALATADALRRGRHLLLGAPTGYGKTAAALHAALSVSRDTGQRVFFATARTTQQAMASATVQAMAQRGLPIRAVAIRAREKICLNDVVACRPDCCAYAETYHDKVRDGDLLHRMWSAHDGTPTVDHIVDTARATMACPFALTLDLVGRADLVIGDLNYVFDPAVRLAEIAENSKDWLVVVDEAHNLPDRAIGYGSPELRLALVDAAVDALTTGPLASVARPFAEVAEDLGEWLRAGIATVSRSAPDGEEAGAVADVVDRRLFTDIATRFEALALDYALLKAERSPFPPGTPDHWLDCARAVGRLKSTLQRPGPDTLAIWRRGRSRGRLRRPVPGTGQLNLLRSPASTPDPRDPAGLKLLCRDPGRILGPVFSELGGSVCMSATLEPQDFYTTMLGLPSDKVETRRERCPFPRENRVVRVCAEVSTAWRDRDRDRERTASLISEAVNGIPGNVAVFFPSFAFRDAVLPLLALENRPTLVQPRGMPEEERSRFIETLERAEGHVLLAVLGGIFSEGVDLPGNALLGAIVVGPALPQANLERRLLQAWFQQQHGEGFRYAWLVPGMCRVVQAAGRVVRTDEDRGAIVLVGQRFKRMEYAALLPEEWSVARTRGGLLGPELRRFFAQMPAPREDEPPDDVPPHDERPAPSAR